MRFQPADGLQRLLIREGDQLGNRLIGAQGVVQLQVFCRWWLLHQSRGWWRLLHQRCGQALLLGLLLLQLGVLLGPLWSLLMALLLRLWGHLLLLGRRGCCCCC